MVAPEGYAPAVIDKQVPSFCILSDFHLFP